MKLTILAIGRAKDGPEQALCSGYLGRLPWPAELREFEVRKPLPAPDKQKQESDMLLAAIPDGAVVVALDGGGRDLTSPQLAEKLRQWQDDGRRDVVFLIGGADGHTDAVKARADFKLAMGRMTWPHMLARAMLAEQLYRASTILAGHPYHRG